MIDPIVEEVRRIREAHAAKFNYDLDAIFRDIKLQEQLHGRRFIDGVANFVTPQAESATEEVVGQPTIQN